MKNSLKAGIGVAVIALAVAAVPFGATSAATQSANSTVDVTADSTISIDVGGDVNISTTPTSSGVVGTGSYTVTVNTNAANVKNDRYFKYWDGVWLYTDGFGLCCSY